MTESGLDTLASRITAFIFLVAVLSVAFPNLGARSFARRAFESRVEQSKAPADQDRTVWSPYLQLGNVALGDSSARIDVVWHASPDASRWAVEYKESSDSVWKNAAEPHFRLVDVQSVPAHRVYDVTIGQLAPGRPFDYRLLRNGASVFTGHAVAKNSEKQNYRFVVFGDCGANTPSQRKVAYESYLAKPNFVVIPGDIVYEGGRISEYGTNFFSIYESLEASPDKGAPLLSSTTMIAAPGNHDTNEERDEGAPDVLAYFLYWIQPLNGPPLTPGGLNSPVPPEAAADAAFENGAGPAYPTMENFSFNWGNSHWLILDSNYYVNWNDPALRKWVEDDLKQASAKQWRFVAFHHPGFNSSREHFEDQWMRCLSDVFRSGKVDIVFSGHVHNYQRSKPLTFQIGRTGKSDDTSWKSVVAYPVDGKFSFDSTFDGVGNTRPNGVIYIVSGGGGATLYNPEQQTEPESWQKFTSKFVSQIHSFTVVDIHGKSLVLKQVSEDGGVLDQIHVTK